MGADLTGGLHFAADDPQCLPPLRHVSRVRVQCLYYGDDQIRVEPSAAGLETVHDGGLLGQLADRPTGCLPGRVDAVFDRLVGRIAGPDFQ